MFSEPTKDHATIRHWARTHGATPAERLPTHVDGEQPVLSFIFRGVTEDAGRLQPIPWEHFFERFDLLGLAFIGSDEIGLEGKEYRILHDPADSAQIGPLLK